MKKIWQKILGSLKNIPNLFRKKTSSTPKTGKSRKMSIYVKILLPANLLLVLVCVILGVSSYFQIKDSMISMGIEQADMAAASVVSVLDGDLVEELEPGDESGSNYYSLLLSMRGIQESCGIKYLYTLYEEDGIVYYGVDTATEDTSYIGDECEDSLEELQTVFNGEEFVMDHIEEYNGDQLISVYKPIYNSMNEQIGVLGSDYDAGEIIEQLNNILLKVILISVGCLILAVIVLFFIIRTIMRSMKIVDRKLYDLVNNEGDLTQKLDIHSGDELEDIANNVNSLLEYIRGIMLNISHNSKQLTASSKQVVQNLSGAEMNISDVSATMEEMSAAMEETNASLNQVNDAISLVYEAIESISEQAGQGSEHSSDIMQNAKQIYENAILRQEEAAVLAQQMAASVNEKIEMSKAVQEINALTENIIGITQQTNLLSLNASIEAARAGEAGRGFAVVADEIGKLAANSAEAAAEIKKVSADVINAVNLLAHESEAMLKFMDETAMDGYEKLLETSDQYLNDVENMNQMMQHFAGRSEELTSNMDDIKEAISAVTIAVEETAKGVTNVTEMAVDLTSNVQDIGDEADGNMEVANKLNTEVNKFKLQ